MKPRTRFGLAVAGLVGLAVAWRAKDDRPRLRPATTRPPFRFLAWIRCAGNHDPVRYTLGGAFSCRRCGRVLGDEYVDYVPPRSEAKNFIRGKGRA